MSPPTRVPGTVGRQATDVGRGPVGSGSSYSRAKDSATAELQSIAIDLVQLGFDLAGFVDPTPISDGASGLIALGRGQWLDAVISGVSMIPYVGDLAKAGKLPKYLKTIEKAIQLADKSADAAKALVPGMKKLEEILDLIPAGANQSIDNMRTRIAEFLARQKTSAARIAKNALPDISGRFKFPPIYTVTKQGGKKYQVKEASGRLGVPGKVNSHRQASESVQRKVSAGSGDDAGHLIGDQFGAPPAGGNLSQLTKKNAAEKAGNLSRQNWIQNQGGGTYHDLETEWAEKLTSGTGVEVKVREFFPDGTNRPAFREVEWTEIAPDGRVSRHQRSFMNTHTPDVPHREGSRTRQDVKPTVPPGTKATVHDIKTGKRID